MAVMNMVSRDDMMDRRRPLRDQVYDLLRERIVTGHFAPGASIDDKELAAELGISRTPVREAVKKLSDEHLVDVIAQSGTRVSRIDRNEVRQAYLIRRALEMESAAQAAALMTADHVEALNGIIAKHVRCIEQKRYADAIAADDEFHRTIAGVSNLNRLWLTVEISKAQLDRCRHLMIPRTGEAEATLKQHRDIVKGLQNGPDAARDAMAKHLDAAYGNTAKVLEAESAGSFAPFTTRG